MSVVYSLKHINVSIKSLNGTRGICPRMEDSSADVRSISRGHGFGTASFHKDREQTR